MKHPKVNNYLYAATIVPSAPIRIGDGVIKGHIDAKSAYTQHARAPFYAGFPLKIQQWRRLPEGLGQPFVEKHFGIYKVRVLSVADPIFIKLGLTGVHILPSPEVLYYMSRGVEFELQSAVFCSAGDISYDDEMFQEFHVETGLPFMEGDEGKKIKAYKKWAGCLGYDMNEKHYQFKGTQLWANHLATIPGVKNVWFNAGRITVVRSKEYNHTTHHILAFITAYCRINVLEAMRKVKNPVAVVLDGIFYADEEPPVVEGFPEKEYEREPRCHADSKWYDDCSDVDDSFMRLLTEEDMLLLSNCVLAGAGGCGKTFSILSDDCFHDIVYVVPNHDLGKDKKEDERLKANYATANRVAGIDCESLAQRGRQPACFLWDELTMTDSSWIEKARPLYPNTLFLMAGDIERRPDGSVMALQCRNGKPGMFNTIWNPPLTWNWRFYTNDYRSKDEEIKALKLQLRAWMREYYTDGGDDDAGKIEDKLLSSGRPVVRLKEAAAMFKPEDTWISGTHLTSTRLLKLGVCSGWVCKDGEERGTKRKTEMVGKSWEQRGSYTTHSYQGQTVESGRVFITTWDGFEHAMLYTAISRAVSMDQIVLVVR
jgi:hypothetical protein